MSTLRLINLLLLLINILALFHLKVKLGMEELASWCFMISFHSHCIPLYSASLVKSTGKGKKRGRLFKNPDDNHSCFARVYSSQLYQHIINIIESN